MTVVGAGYGGYDSSVGVRVGGSACESSVWSDDYMVVCVSAAGADVAKSVSVSVGAQVGSMSAAVSYDVVLVIRADDASNIMSSGGSSVTVLGAGFGVDDYSLEGRVGGSACNVAGLPVPVSTAAKAAHDLEFLLPTR